MQLRRLIFVDFDVTADQAAVAVPGGGYRRIVVRFRGVDDSGPAAPPDPPDAPDHRSRRCEISEDHIEPPGALHVPADASPPTVANAQGATELPLQRSAPFIV